jgi:sporulation protein YlmC with PRC-barrel domain
VACFFEVAPNLLLEKELVRMRRISILLSVLVLAAMVLAACGGEETSTSIPTQNVPPVTVEATETESPTEVATEAPTEVTTTETPGIPVTGNVNPASLSEELTFPVLSQDGQQIGSVSDMVLDLDNTNVAYVVVDTSGFGDLGDRQILVPWDSLQLQTGTGTGTETGTGLATATTDAGAGGTGLATATTSPGTVGTGLATNTPSVGTGGTDLATATADTGTDGTGLATATAGTGTGGNTGGQQNAFILQTDQDTFSNAPDFDLSNLPAMGQPASDWDLEIRNYWQNGGSGTGTGVATATSGTGTGGTGLATATTDTSTSGTGLATATATTGTGTGLATATAGTGTGTGTGQGTTALQGVVLATDILGSTVTIGAQGTGTGTDGTDLATATPGTGTGGTGLATATTDTSTGGTGLATATTSAGLATATTGPGTGTGSIVATIEDMIIATDTGDIQYIILNTNAGTQQLIPVPLSVFQWDNTAQGFALNVDSTMLQNAPTLENGQIPDTTTSGWNSQFDTFWQNNGAGGSGTGTGSGNGLATVTPTP